MPEQDETISYLDNPLNGRLVTASDPIVLQPNDFSVLRNFRYTDTGIRGIRGMTKINASATAYKAVRNGFHFKADRPGENHILVQTNDSTAPATASRLVKSDGSAAIPAQDTFTSFLTLDNNNPVYFSKAPDGCVAACNGTKNYVWGGNEFRTSGFVMFDPSDSTKFYDYTDQVNNTLTDALNVATIKSLGSYASHYPPAYSATYVKATTAQATYEAYRAVDPSEPLTGAAAGNSWAGTAGTSGTNQRFHIDLGSAKVVSRIYYENYHNSGAETTAGARNFTFWGSNTAASFADTTYATDTGWTQITTSASAFEQHAAADTADPKYITATNTTAYRYYAFKFADTFGGTTMGVRHIELQAQESTDIYVGSTRPVKGIKFYIGTANTSVATATPYYWNGSWTACTTPVDGTSSGGIAFAQTGSITFDDTEALAKPSIINNVMLYWYKLSCDPINDSTTIYRCTVDATIQSVKDLWDGVPRTIYSFLTYTSSYADYTLNTYKYDYDSGDDGTVVNVSDMTSSQYIICGFAERCSGISFALVGSNTNTTAATTMTVSYWDGDSWVTVGTISDGTSLGGISFSKSGIVTWTPPTASLEFTYNPNNTSPLYYYKISFDKTIDNTASKVYVDYVYGIPAQSEIHGYRFPLFWQNRLLLCSDQSGKKNWVRYSSANSVCTFNGSDASEFPVDGDDEIMCGATLFTRFGGDLYDNAVLCKRNSTFLLDVDASNASLFKLYTISTNIGCVAPLTMKLCDIGYDVAKDIKKHVLIWLSAAGLIMFDGVSLSPISDDVKDLFDPLNTNSVNRSYIHLAAAEFDPVEQEYHLFVPTGSSTTCDQEWVYSLKTRKFSQFVRGTTTKFLQCAWTVEDTLGNKYLYGGTTDGYIERLEYGTTFDGNSIVYTFRPGELAPFKNTFKRSSLEAVQLIGKVKTTTTQTISFTHYADGSTTGTTLTAQSQNVSGARIFRKYQSTKGQAHGIFHTVECSIATNNENIGCEPILLSYQCKELGDSFN